MSVDISGLDKAEVLAALWRGSHTQGLSFLGVKPTGIEEAKAALQHDEDFAKEMDEKYPNSAPHDVRHCYDYWNGHVLKVDLTGDEFDPYLYDRDNYEGAAAHVIARLRAEKDAA